MEGIQRIHDLDIIIRRDDVARLLGYTGSAPPPRVTALLDQIENQAARLVDPACMYRHLAGSEAATSSFLRGAGDVVLCLVTIGPRLEREVESLKDHGQLARALVLDAYGSAAAEAAAEAANAIIVREMETRGLSCSRRFSPGYGRWNVDEQRWVLPALDSRSIGVSLTEGCMMTPRKSVSFAVTVGVHPVELRSADLCDACGAADCTWRDTPYKCFARAE